MPKQLLAVFALSGMLLTACGGGGATAENAGKAMADITCLAFSNPDLLLSDEMPQEALDILAEYGFESEAEADVFVAGLNDEEQNEALSAMATQLDSQCGDDLEAFGISAQDMVDAMGEFTFAN